ncbi:hypothetical protein N7448_008216 [Penicillium atrosanguineum]|nr:hypothetical protein N7448_008216 [Penicillium atrosanguineum]
MAVADPPPWLLPSIYPSTRCKANTPPTWLVVFICPLEDIERTSMMTKLSSVDEEWPNSPRNEMRRLVEIPWLMDYKPPTSVIFHMLKEDPLIFIDDQSRADHSAIIAWKTSKESVPEAARVPIGRANMLLGIAVEGGLSSEYTRILPEPEEEKAVQVTRHLTLYSTPFTPTLISLVHLSKTVQENIESMIDCPTIIHNWPENQEPCSRAQHYRMFQALKICREGNYQAFAFFIDDDAEGYHIVTAKGSSVPNFSDPEASKLELYTLPFDKVAQSWNAAWNPESHIPTRLPSGPYMYNPAMYEIQVSGGEPIVNPDDIAGSLDTDVVFILEQMTPTELRKIQSEMFTITEQNWMWVDVSDRLASPDIQGLLTYFESGAFTKYSPPNNFLAVDRKTLSDAIEPIDDRDDCEAIIVASYEEGDVWFHDDMYNTFGHISTGYGYERRDPEEADSDYISLSIENVSWSEMCGGSPIVYWSAYRAWAEEHSDGDNAFKRFSGNLFARSFGLDGMKVYQEGKAGFATE